MKAHKAVEKILARSEETRNSDKELHLHFMALHGIYLSREEQARFRKMPSLETATRIRRKFQERGAYVATKQVKAMRDDKAMVIEQNAPSAKPERLATLFDDSNYRRF